MCGLILVISKLGQKRKKKEKEGKKRKNENTHKPLTAHDPMAAGAVRLGNLKQATLEM